MTLPAPPGLSVGGSVLCWSLQRGAPFRRALFGEIAALLFLTREQVHARQDVGSILQRFDLLLPATADPAPTPFKSGHAKQVFHDLERIEPGHVPAWIDPFGVK